MRESPQSFPSHFDMRPKQCPCKHAVSSMEDPAQPPPHVMPVLSAAAALLLLALSLLLLLHACMHACMHECPFVTLDAQG